MKLILLFLISFSTFGFLVTDDSIIDADQLRVKNSTEITLNNDLDANSNNIFGVNDFTVTGTTTLNTSLNGFVKAVSGVISSQAFISLLTDVSGILPIANGGTNSSSALTNNLVMVSAGGAIVENANDVSTTELSYLNGVTSAIQTQIDSKQNDVITTEGDIVIGNVSGEESRLAIGTNGQLLTSNGTTASWQDAPVSTTLDTKGQIQGYSTQNANIGPCTDDQILVYDALEATGWKCSPLPSTSPTTTVGDLIYNNTGTAAGDTRLAIGSENQVLTVSSGIPSWENASASPSFSVVTKTTTATLATTGEDFVLADASSGTFTITLPPLSGNDGIIYRIKKDDPTSNHVTVDGNGTETIGGKTTRTIFTQNDFIYIVADETNSDWKILNKKNTIFVLAQGNSSDAITANTEDIPFSTVVTDTAGAWTNAGNTGADTNDSFTCPNGESGEYQVEVYIRISGSTTAEISAYIDGSFFKFLGAFAARTNDSFSGTIHLDEGEVLTFRTDIGFTLLSTTNDHYVTIRKLY